MEYVLTLIGDPLKRETVEKLAVVMDVNHADYLEERRARDIYFEHWPATKVARSFLGVPLFYAMMIFCAWSAALLHLPALWSGLAIAILIGFHLTPWAAKFRMALGKDLPEVGNPEEIKKALEQIEEEDSIDSILQPTANRPKKLLISDMDSTMITVECIDELADFVGKKPEVAAITERAMNGELNFEAALTERVALLKGLPEEVLEQCYRERVKPMPGAKELLSAARAAGMHCVLVSGGFTFFTARVAEELGFHEHHANVLEVENGLLTGRVKLPILGKEAKLATLNETCARLGITPAGAVAIGDGANDLPMLLAAGLGIAYHAKPVVQAEAAHCLNHCDLRGVMWALGLKGA